LPVYDVSDEVATIVDADPQTVWEALMNADLLEVSKRVPLAGVLGALRMLPEIVSHNDMVSVLRKRPNRCACANSPRCNPSKVVGSSSANDRERSSHSASSASSGGP